MDESNTIYDADNPEAEPANRSPIPASPRHVPTIPGYEILSELGRGGMGVVYKARQTKLNRLVALKMILTKQHASLKQKVRFQLEAEAVARLHHPHIIHLHEIGEHEGLPFFSLEYCEGGTLARYLKDKRPSARKSALLAEKLARAIHHAHSRGVIHRDLKPANVLLTADGKPKVSDFGLAKCQDADDGASQSGAIVGTPSYMAPEQAAGHRDDIGPATDVYALGAILYELLTGRPPFEGSSAVVLVDVLEREPVPPTALRPEVPRDLETICLKCLHKDPGRRYDSAEALADDLRRFQVGEPIRARPIGGIERIVKWIARRPAVAGLIAGLVAAIVLGVTGIGWKFADARKHRKEAVALADEFREQKELRRRTDPGGSTSGRKLATVGPESANGCGEGRRSGQARESSGRASARSVGERAGHGGTSATGGTSRRRAATNCPGDLGTPGQRHARADERPS